MTNPYTGHNQPPEQLAQADLDRFMIEAENWLDGERVTNDGQMQAVDEMIAEIKVIEKQTEEAWGEEYRPAKAIADAVSARFKGVRSEIPKVKKGLIALVDGYKREKAAEAERVRLEKEREAERLHVEAEAAKHQTDYANLEDRRFADQKAQEARIAAQEAQRAGETAPKGTRLFEVVEVSDPRAFWSWMQKNNPQDVHKMLEDAAKAYIRKGVTPDGVIKRKERRAI